MKFFQRFRVINEILTNVLGKYQLTERHENSFHYY